MTPFGPVRIRVRVTVRRGEATAGTVVAASAVAELTPDAGTAAAAYAAGGGYDGPPAYRQGKPFRTIPPAGTRAQRRRRWRPDRT